MNDCIAEQLVLSNRTEDMFIFPPSDFIWSGAGRVTTIP